MSASAKDSWGGCIAIAVFVLFIGVSLTPETEREPDRRKTYSSQPGPTHHSTPTPFLVQGQEPRYFKGYPCTLDCSGHEAGYEWAEENGIDDPDDCDGKSESFIEGCRAYAIEQQDENDDENEGDDEER